MKFCQYAKEDLLNIWYVPEHLKTQEMCNEAVQMDPWALRYVPDHFVTQEMCNEAVEKSLRPKRCTIEQWKIVFGP